MKQGGILFWSFSSIALCYLGQANPTRAQIVPDTTLPVNSTVTPAGSTLSIAGGTRGGDNLFHSFKEFSVPTGSTAYFNNSLDVQNIITRVTGRSISNIDGILKANGTANLFLLNPNGIIFGPNASLNIGGSFLASTARAVKLSDGTEFSAIAPNQTSSLLRVNVPIGLQYGSNPGSIVNQSRAIDSRGEIVGLQVLPSKTIAIAGGEIQLEGGQITAPQGRIELGSIADNNLVSLQPIETGFALGYGGVQNFQNIQFSQQAAIDASGIGSGQIHVNGGQVTLTEGSKIVANTLGNQNGGGISIQARQLLLQDGAFISSSTFGQGKAGDLTVRATESVELVGNRNVIEVLGRIIDNDFTAADLREGLFTVSFSPGSAGNLAIETNHLVLKGGALVSPSTFANGRGGNLTVIAPNGVVELISSVLLTGTAGSQAAGDLTVTARRLSIREGGGIATTTLSSGSGGNLTINTSELTEMIGAENSILVPTSRGVNLGYGISFLYTTSLDSGSAGKLTINTRQLTLKGSSGILSGGLGSQSVAGDLIVNASDLVELNPTTQAASFAIGLSSTTIGIANGGNLTINTKRLMIHNGVQIQTATFGAGRGGTLTVNASESVELIGTSVNNVPSGLFVSGELNLNGSPVTGDAGNLIINTGRLIIRDGARVSASNQGLGRAGNIEIIAPSILLDNGGSIRAIAKVGDRGNIVLRSQSLEMRRGSQITTNATNTATGGNITIDTGVLAALENSDISANSQEARGGRVSINAQGIFGTEARSQPTLNSDITATGGTPELSGTIDIQTPNINPTSSLLVLPQTPVDVASLIDRRCSTGNAQISRFINVGRGGQPPSPSEPLNSSAGWVDERQIARNTENPSVLNGDSDNSSDHLVEAQGWVINASGQVELVADAPVVTPYSFWSLTPPCNGGKKAVN